MAQQGGLGRGLASLIPQRKTNSQKNKISTTSIVKASGKATSTKKMDVKKKKRIKNNSIGEANYFGGQVASAKTKLSKNSKVAIKTNSKKNESSEELEAEKPFKKIALKSVMEVGTEEVSPNPYQPRTDFDSTKLQELADSIQEHGIIQPLVVSHDKKGGYELIAGERRLEASKLAGLKRVPVVTRTATNQNKAEWALIENIQRHNLNPIEEAQAYQRMRDEFSLTQDEIARKVGKNRSTVANILRLLKLPQEIKDALMSGKITEGHARTILAINDQKKQINLFKSILRDGLNVRQVESATKRVNINKDYKIKKNIDPDLLNIENQISDNLNTKVKIRGIKNNGKILIDYYSEEELGQIVAKLRGEK